MKHYQLCEPHMIKRRSSSRDLVSVSRSGAKFLTSCYILYIYIYILGQINGQLLLVYVKIMELPALGITNS
jgi:hypothetical protein